jgi:hypothetical protein
MPSSQTAAVRVVLANGGQRVVEHANAARLDGPFFLVLRHAAGYRVSTVLTLRAEDVVGAEILLNGNVTEYVRGGASQD